MINCLTRWGEGRGKGKRVGREWEGGDKKRGKGKIHLSRKNVSHVISSQEWEFPVKWTGEEGGLSKNKMIVYQILKSYINNIMWENPFIDSVDYHLKI